MKERILVPLDGTKAGEAVIPKLEGLVFGSVPGAEVEVTLLRIIPIVNFNVLTRDERAQLPYSESDRKELYRNALIYLEKVAGNLRSKGFKVKTMVKIGPAAEEIIKAAHEISASLIAMATHGLSGILRWARGSVADEVIRREGTIPVLTVHTPRKGAEKPLFSPGSLGGLTGHYRP
jgi:nucleotide-binding universal stress UspA family protein